MKNLAFDFVVDKENNRVQVKREYDAERDLVWKAWTTAELLDQWWAPAPYKAVTSSMDFKKGGAWFYAMVSPEGEKHRCRADYKAVDAPTSFSYVDAFCDEKGNITSELPAAFWTTNFGEVDGITTVDITLDFEDPENLKKIIEMGFKEGFTAGLDNLEQLLQTLKTK